MSATRRHMLMLLVVAVTVHALVMAAVAWRSGRVDVYAFASLDAREYATIAANLAEHGAFSQSPHPPLTPDTWRTPGYPFFLAIVVAIFGANPIVLIGAQQLLSILNVLLLFTVARRHMPDRRAMLVAGLFLIEPYHLYYSMWLMATTLFTTILLLCWLGWERSRRDRSPWWPIATGLLAGLTVLVRPVAVLVPVVLLVGQAIAVARKTPSGGALRTRRVAIACLLFASGAALPISAWMTRNRIVAGEFALSSQSGVVLAYFKAAEVTLWRDGRTTDRYVETSVNPDHANAPHGVWDSIDAKLQQSFPDLQVADRTALTWRNLAQGNRTDVDSFALSAALAQIGWSDLTAAPLSTLMCCAARAGMLLTFPLNLAIEPPPDVQTPRWRHALVGAVYTVLLLAVIVRLVQRRVALIDVFFPLTVVASLLLATTPQLDPRFRVPMIPLLLCVMWWPRCSTDCSDTKATGRS